MLRCSADHATSSLSLERVDGTRKLVVVAERCPNLHSISLRGGTLTDAALASIAIAMRGRLRSLDLRETQGFGDLGLKAIAAFSEGLELLRLGGCAVTDAGVEKVCLFCHELRLLEVPVSPAVSTTSFAHLSKDCKVERFDREVTLPSYAPSPVPPPAPPPAPPAAAPADPEEPAERPARAARASSTASNTSSSGGSSGEQPSVATSFRGRLSSSSAKRVTRELWDVVRQDLRRVPSPGSCRSGSIRGTGSIRPGSIRGTGSLSARGPSGGAGAEVVLRNPSVSGSRGNLRVLSRKTDPAKTQVHVTF